MCADTEWYGRSGMPGVDMCGCAVDCQEDRCCDCGIGGCLVKEVFSCLMVL